MPPEEDALPEPLAVSARDRAEDEATHAPPRPGALEEAFSSRLFRWLAPRLPRRALPEPPPELAPFEHSSLPRRDRGHLTATLFPVDNARGTVLLLAPWLEWGRAYFHRRRRIPALRAAGYRVLTADLPGFDGTNGPTGLYDLATEDMLRSVQRRWPDDPIFVWGVSSGGYWAHAALSRTQAARGAFFEDVSPHLLEWSTRMAPLGKPAYRFFASVFRRSYRFLDLRLHAPHLGVQAVAYLTGKRDPGVRPGDTQSLAQAAGGDHRIIPKAGHLGAIKIAEDEVIDLALRTFEKALAG
ncbi:MAG: alpha/beta fold hydrolase [Acidobacteriota bacterium]